MLIALAHQSIRRPKAAGSNKPKQRAGLDKWN
jgi:multicomponent K+:H+ antiporter subunit A